MQGCMLRVLRHHAADPSIIDFNACAVAFSFCKILSNSVQYPIHNSFVLFLRFYILPRPKPKQVHHAGVRVVSGNNQEI